MSRVFAPDAVLPTAAAPQQRLHERREADDALMDQVRPLFELPRQLQAVAMRAMGLDESEVRAMDWRA